MTVAASVLQQRVLEYLNDYLSVATTTAITTNNSIVSTNLQAFDDGADDKFNQWWCYITDYANAGVERQISDYATATGTCTIRGAALASDSSNKATVIISRVRYSDVLKAINRAVEEEYGGVMSLHRGVDDQTLVTGNILPNSHFEDWAASTAPDKYSLSSVTATANTTAGNYRGGSTSAKVAATAGNGYLYITSDTYPALLDLAGRTIDFKCWANPQTADDAALVIYTVKPDGTAQTLTSTTSNPAGKFSLITLTGQAINAGIEEIQFRFKVATNGQYVYFDDARVTNTAGVYDYLLPTRLRVGSVDQVDVQAVSTGNYDDGCDDLRPRRWNRQFVWRIEDQGTEQHLFLPWVAEKLRIRLIGTTPLEPLSAQTDTISLNQSGATDYLVVAAARWLVKMQGRPASSDDTKKLKQLEYDIERDYTRLKMKHGMMSPSGTLKGID